MVRRGGGGGGARSRRGRIFRSGVCFDAPSHIPYVFQISLKIAHWPIGSGGEDERRDTTENKKSFLA